MAAIPTPNTALALGSMLAAALLCVAEAEAEALLVALPLALPLALALVTAAVAVADPLAPPGTLALLACVIERVLVTAPLNGVTLMERPVDVTDTVDPTEAPGAPEVMSEATPGG